MAAVVSPSPGVAADDAELERQWTDVFNSNSRVMDLQFACYNLMIIGVGVRKLGTRSLANVALLIVLPGIRDFIMLYMQLRRYPLFRRRRELFAVAARLLRLGEPPPAVLPAARVQGSVPPLRSGRIRRHARRSLFRLAVPARRHIHPRLPTRHAAHVRCGLGACGGVDAVDEGGRAFAPQHACSMRVMRMMQHCRCPRRARAVKAPPPTHHFQRTEPRIVCAARSRPCR
jgi:hypothetical protein